MDEFVKGQKLLWLHPDGSTEECEFLQYEFGVCVIADKDGKARMVPSNELSDPVAEAADRMREACTCFVEHLNLAAELEDGTVVRIIRMCDDSAIVVKFADPEKSEFQYPVHMLKPFSMDIDAVMQAKENAKATFQKYDQDDAVVQDLMDAVLRDKSLRYYCRVRGAEFISMHKQKKQWYFVVFSPEGTKEYYTKDQLMKKFDILYHQPRCQCEN